MDPPTTPSTITVAHDVLRRGPVLVLGLVAATGGAVVYLVAQPGLWRMAWPYGAVFAALGLIQLAAAAAVLARPSRAMLGGAAAAALAVVALWALARVLAVLPDPDPWAPVNSVIGFTGDLCAALQALAAVLLAVLAVRGPRPRRSLRWRVLGGIGLAPLALVVLLLLVVGVAGASDGMAGAGFPAGTVDPRDLPAGERSTMEYCRPAGMPLAMDIYTPPAAARTGRPAPVALYVHGGGIWGDRKLHGLGANQANHAGALFTPLRRQLNAQGFVVASIDYRLPPATPWPAQLQDAKCAVRFLRAHAPELGIDPGRIGAWSSSGGGWLVSLLGLAGPDAGFDTGQYPEASSRVQAVVDMFGMADLTDLGGTSAFGRFLVHAALGSSPAIRRGASPITYVTPGAPPFLILHGTEDSMMPPHQSTALAGRLRAAGVPATLILVAGAGHDGFTSPDQRPPPMQLTSMITDFFATTLGPGSRP
jgi:acetyl esterase/lipase